MTAKHRDIGDLLRERRRRLRSWMTQTPFRSSAKATNIKIVEPSLGDRPRHSRRAAHLISGTRRTGESLDPVQRTPSRAAAAARQSDSAQPPAASLSFFIGRTLILVLAGLAGNQRSCPVDGALPKRVFFAGTLTTVALSSPGSVN